MVFNVAFRNKIYNFRIYYVISNALLNDIEFIGFKIKVQRFLKLKFLMVFCY